MKLLRKNKIGVLCSMLGKVPLACSLHGKRLPVHGSCSHAWQLCFPKEVRLVDPMGEAYQMGEAYIEATYSSLIKFIAWEFLFLFW